jgi:hypothetical protein
MEAITFSVASRGTSGGDVTRRDADASTLDETPLAGGAVGAMRAPRLMRARFVIRGGRRLAQVEDPRLVVDPRVIRASPNVRIRAS